MLQQCEKGNSSVCGKTPKNLSSKYQTPMDSACAGFAKQAWELSNQSGVDMMTTKGGRNSLASIYFSSSLCGMQPPWYKLHYTRPYLAASAPCKAVSPLSKPRTSTWRAGKRWMKVSPSHHHHHHHLHLHHHHHHHHHPPSSTETMDCCAVGGCVMTGVRYTHIS